MSDMIQDAYDSYLQQRKAGVAELRPLLLKALSAANVALVEIEYDGYGDSGQIEKIVGTDTLGRGVSLKDKLPERHRLRKRRFTSLDDALDSFAWSLVALHYHGFENNEGGMGEIRIDVASGKISIDHNQRFTDYTNTELEV